MITLAVLAALMPGAHAQPDAGEAVLKLLFFGFCSEAPRKIVDAPSDVVARLDAFAERCVRFSAQHPQPEANSLDGMVADAHWMYEGRLFALARMDTAEREASDYVRALRPCYEWEGYHDCPEREAVFAERYLTDHPSSAFAEYLPLLAAHRWVCAAEAYDYELKNHVTQGRGRVGLSEARRRATADLGKAIVSPDRLVRFAAEALKRTPTCFP